MNITIFGHTFHFLTEQHQWEKLYGYFQAYIEENKFGQVAILLMIESFLFLLLSLKLKGRLLKVIEFIAIVLYSVSCFLLLVYCRESGNQGIRLFRLNEYVTSDGFHETQILIFLLQLMLFIPFGFLVRKFLGKCHKMGIFLITCEMAMIVEGLQYCFAKGYTAPQDFVAYILGSGVGIVIFQILEKNFL